METFFGLHGRVPPIPLETSLVEWKLDGSYTGMDERTHLGNFLSGMETGEPPRRWEWGCPALETSLVEWKHHEPPEQRIMKAALETSLVEWKLLGHLRLGLVGLRALETSLVEWKPPHRHEKPPPFPLPWKLP